MRGPGGDGKISTFTLGGLIDRLVMLRTEAQLPVSDPLGVEGDRDRAADVRERLYSTSRLSSPERGAQFMPLCGLRLDVRGGRIIDSLGQFISWEPEGGKALPAETIRGGGSKPDAILPP